MIRGIFKDFELKRMQNIQELVSKLLLYSPWKAKFTRWGIHLEFGYLTGNIKSGPFRGEMSLWLGGRIIIRKITNNPGTFSADRPAISLFREQIVFEKKYPAARNTGRGNFDLYRMAIPAVVEIIEFDASENSLLVGLDTDYLIHSIPGEKGSLASWSFIDRRNNETRRYTVYKDAVECHDNEYPEEVLWEWEISEW